ncbi:hypothetical protein SAMN05216553_101409 [Lentzea fradiae]|uniref:Uncharacterized protein n=1 Tax=Lentzea fradiae TaxID=200378 RepID=A0A1G7KPS4_9PSEU|nr:hypothetical protein [Lentzea fradiae]SDF39233.1 hypothetical protein SAMN05216553_101409 [Lentzea fradiae]
MSLTGVDAHDIDEGAPPVVGEVEEIAAHADPVVRNLRITQCYHRLSRVLAARTGGAANWCTFAVWASKQVGRTIRQEDLADTAGRLLKSSPELAAGVDLVVHGLKRAVRREVLGHAHETVRKAVVATARLDDVSAAAARGNLKVFEEIAREFARFLAEFGPDQVHDEEKIREFCAALRPGEPPEGQRYLRKAFTRYHRAMTTDDPKQRAELLLLANIEVGLHEQTRLQPEIAAALQAPVVDPRELERRLFELVLPGNRVMRWLRLVLLTVLGRRTAVRAATEQLAEQARAVVRRAVTKHLMTLSLPGGETLDLSVDLPATFPPLLAELAEPELLALLELVDPSPDSLAGTAARDWADLPDRLHYIADMFRCHALREDLLTPPFTAEQVEAMTAGRRPTGRL